MPFRFVVAFAALWPSVAAPCPFCSSSGTTLTQDANSAGLVLYGVPTNAKLDPRDVNQGTTELKIEVVIKSHDILAGRKVITLPRYIPQLDPAKPMKYLVFCDVYKGELDPYRGTPFSSDSRIAAYLQGGLAVKDKPVPERLKYFFDYLNDADADISNDAYTEFGNSDYKDFRPMAEKLPAAKVLAWLRDPATPTVRYGLYGSMLGHCGGPAEADVLRQLIDDPQRRFLSGLDGLLAGYVLLRPAEGAAYLAGILADDRRDFLLRYAGLRTARFFWDYRSDVVKRDAVREMVLPMLDHKDIADLAVEDLRKWGQWQVAERVLGLAKRPSHDVPIIRRAILRYAVSCPASASPAVKEYVAACRAKDARWVEEVEEILRSESAPAAAPK